MIYYYYSCCFLQLQLLLLPLLLFTYTQARSHTIRSILFTGWVKRRETETAKTIADIHKEVAQEEQAKNSNSRRSSSHANLRRSSSLASAAITHAASQVDGDGFTSISRGSFKKVNSKNNLSSNNNNPGSSANSGPSGVKPLAKSSLRRAMSQPTNMNTVSTASPLARSKMTNKFAMPEDAEENLNAPNLESSKEKKPPLKTPDECSKKIQNILKEFFVAGDLDDAVLSVDELVQVNEEDLALERGAKVMEGAALLVMEGKPDEVVKTVEVLKKAFVEGKILPASIPSGLADPLEFLSDIEIDAPLAGNHVAMIIAHCMASKVLELDFLKEAPEFFRTDGKPAVLACKVLKALAKLDASEFGAATEGQLAVVEALMTEDDRAKYPTAQAMLEA